MSRLVSYFLRGVVFVVPMGLTVWVLVGAFRSADDWARERFYLPFPGLGFVALVVAITLVGFLASNFLTKSIMRAVEHLFDRLPVIKMLHGAVKDLLSAFVGDKRKFDRPVIVSLSADDRLIVPAGGDHLH